MVFIRTNDVAKRGRKNKESKYDIKWTVEDRGYKLLFSNLEESLKYQQTRNFDECGYYILQNEKGRLVEMSKK